MLGTWLWNEYGNNAEILLVKLLEKVNLKIMQSLEDNRPYSMGLKEISRIK
jgi:hypothetical protein